MAKVVESALLAVTLAGGINQREIARFSGCLRFLVVGQVEVFERHRDFFGETDAYETACRNGVSVANKANCLFGTDNFPAIARTQRDKRRLVAIGLHGSMSKSLYSGYQSAQ
jgi:hypothetical protein